VDGLRLITPIGRRLLTGLAAGALGLLWLPGPSLGDLQGNLSSRSAGASRLRAAIAAETRLIDATSTGVRQAQQRLAGLQSEAAARQARLVAVQHGVVAARDRLTRLENQLRRASTLLRANLVAGYENDPPDLVSVVLDSHGFADLLEQLNFVERIRRQDARILGDTKTARVHVLGEAARLERLEIRDRALTTAVLRSRDAAAAVQGALLARQAAQLRQRATTSAQLHQVRGQIASLRVQIARLANPVTTGLAGGLPIDAGGMAQAPPGAPAAVRQVIAAGNAIAGLPYVYGGGHTSFHASAYDCSGSVSYALAAAGLLSSPLDSTAFESWGAAGAGRWITVYANAGHAFMVVAGWRFDTVALAAGGTRWTRTMTSTAGFVARHPPGL
jgi:cell wall-associated NlpC family hydrolase